MFDIGWVELLFIATMTLVIVGPKDMPRLLGIAGRLVSKARGVYTDLFQSVKQLEQEVDAASGGGEERHDWRNHLPESIRDLPADFVPGSMSAEQHQSRRAAFEHIRQQQSGKKPPSGRQKPH